VVAPFGIGFFTVADRSQFSAGVTARGCSRPNCTAIASRSALPNAGTWQAYPDAPRPISVAAVSDPVPTVTATEQHRGGKHDWP
jgi:hypothetical protein